MSQPFSGIPDPGSPRPFKRRFQPRVIQDALRVALGKAQRHGQDLWWRGKRNPRAVAIVGAAVVVMLVGAYALRPSASNFTLCPSATEAGRRPLPFALLMDPVPHPAVGPKLEIHYDVCGLPSRTPYRGELRLSQQGPVKVKNKKAAKPKPLVVTFHDRVDGVGTRRIQQLALGSTRPGVYTLELSVVDNQGRERKRSQKVLIKAR